MDTRQGTLSDQPVREFDWADIRYVGRDRVPRPWLASMFLVFPGIHQAQTYASFVRHSKYILHALQSFLGNPSAVSMLLTLFKNLAF